MHQGGGGGIWFDAGSYVDDGIAGFVNGGKVAGADGSEDGCAVGCTFFGCNEFDFVSVNIGLNLPPEW